MEKSHQYVDKNSNVIVNSQKNRSTTTFECQILGTDKRKSLTRWRLILGTHADEEIPFDSDSPDSSDLNEVNEVNEKIDTPDEIHASEAEKILKSRQEDLDESLAFLYDREYDPNVNLDEFSAESYQLMEDLWDYQKDRSGGATGSKLFTIPHWINNVKELFPKESQEKLTQDAIERYQLHDILTDPEILENVEPSYHLTKILLSFRDYLSDDTLVIAKQLIRKTVKQLEEQFKQEVITAILGRKHRHSKSPLKIAKNLDIKRTIHHNLQYYDPKQQSLVIDKLFFNSRVHKKQEWHIIICVDQSGSMLDSVIHSAIVASIFASIQTLKTNLLIFDTEVEDLSNIIADPVEVLMSVQLGGGTAIYKVLQVAEKLVDKPDRTILVLITDFYEGGNPTKLFASVKSLHESGVILLGLTAMSPQGEPDYSKNTAQEAANLGMEVLSVTPGKLAGLISDIIQAKS